MRSLRGTPLKRFHRHYRREHPASSRLRALLHNIEDPANVGSIFRIADACGLEQLLLTGITPKPPHPVITRVGRNKQRSVDWRHAGRPEEIIPKLREEGFTLVAIEITDDAAPYQHFSFPERPCLVVGHEEHGIPPATLALCNAAVFLPMYGKGLSLNVHVALGIVCYHIRHASPA
jgi:tRNA (guanosine-2'-O-)-methyltransferase